MEKPQRNESGIYLPSGRKIDFGAYDNARNVEDTTEGDDLVIYNLDHVEGTPGSDGIYEDVAVDPNSILRIYGRIFVLWGMMSVPIYSAVGWRG